MCATPLRGVASGHQRAGPAAEQASAAGLRGRVPRHYLLPRPLDRGPGPRPPLRAAIRGLPQPDARLVAPLAKPNTQVRPICHGSNEAGHRHVLRPYGHAPVASSRCLSCSLSCALSGALSGADRCRGAYSRTWFRPASLARYRARSAAASSSNRSLPCWPRTATPIETVTLILASVAGSVATLSRPALLRSRSAIRQAPSRSE